MADYEKTNTLAVDLDGTLAERQSPFNPLTVGDVIPAMLSKVKAQLAKGRKVVLFTARASTMDDKAEKAIKAWLKEHGLEKLEITCTKTPDITEFWDDRARGVKVDEGHFRELVKDAFRRDRLQQLWTRQGRCPKCGGKPENLDGFFAGGALTCSTCSHSWLIPTTIDDSQGVKQASYTEGGYFTHDGVRYDLDSALATATDAGRVSVKDLQWLLEHAEPDPERLEKADLKAPILLANDRKGRRTVVDGLHRLAKAVRDKEPELPAMDVVTFKQAKEIVRKEVPRTDIVEHCPHCDHQFVEKGGPRLKREEGQPWEDCEYECPACQGEIWMPLPSDEDLENLGTWLGGSRRTEYIQREKDRRERKRAKREAKLQAPKTASSTGAVKPTNFLNTLQRRAGGVQHLPVTPPAPVEGYRNRDGSVLPATKSPQSWSPVMALKPAYGDKWDASLQAARDYRAKNPDIKYVSQLTDEALNTPASVNVHGKLEGVEGRTSPDGTEVELKPGRDATLRHEMRHVTQMRDRSRLGLLMNRVGYQTEDRDAYVMHPLELEARLPELNAAWVRRGGAIPSTPEEAMQVIKHYMPPFDAGSSEWHAPDYTKTTVETHRTKDDSLLGRLFGMGSTTTSRHTPDYPTPAADYRRQEVDSADPSENQIRPIFDSLRRMPPDKRQQYLETLAKMLPGLVAAPMTEQSVKAASSLTELEESLKREAKQADQAKQASTDAVSHAAMAEGVKAPVDHNRRFLSTLRSRATLSGEPAARSVLPTQERDGVNPPTSEQVTPAWFKLPAYGGREGFQRELTLAQQYREKNPDLFNGQQMNWFSSVPTAHSTLGGMFGGGGVYRAGDSEAPSIHLGEPHLKTLMHMGGPLSILEHEATHAALENGQGPEDIGRFGADFKHHGNAYLLNHHDTLPAEMRAYMSKLQEHQFQNTGSRFTTPEQYQDYVKSIPFDNEDDFNKHMDTLPFDTRRMFQQLRKLRGEDHPTFDKIMDWQARSIPGFVDVNSTDNWERKVAALKAPSAFNRPENWDAEDIATEGCKLYCGANDWESGHTWMWVVRKSEADLHGDLVWVAINNPLGRDDSCSSTEAAEAKKIGQQAVEAWIAAAKTEARKNLPPGDKGLGIKPGYWDFLRALQHEEVQKHVWASGELKADPRVKKASLDPADVAPSEVVTNTGPMAIYRALKALDPKALKEAADKDVKSGKITRRDKAVKILQVLDGLQRTGVAPHQLMIKKVPVIPPQFRPYATMGDSLVPGAANELYQDLMRNIDLHKRTTRTLGDAGATLTRRNLLASVRAAYGYGDPVSPKLQGRGTKGFLQQILGDSPKFGFVQRRLLSKPIDSVGRGVITVNPDLDMNQISLPEDMAWELYGSHVQRRLVQRMGMSPGQAFKALADRTPEATNALKQEMTPGIGRPVIYSRAPAWHKFNTVSGWPLMHKGTNIAINPYVTAGLNADFDGDQCINQLLACIPISALPYWRMSHPKIDQHEVKMPANSKVPAVQDGKIFLFDLEEFPHGELQHTKEGANGRIDFHTVPLPIKVVAYDDAHNSLVWADVAFWSKHYARVVEIVDTHNDYQLITDDDPRAVYGTAAGELSMQRFTPTEALNRKVLLPRVRHLPEVEESIDIIDVVQTTDYWKALHLPDTLKLDADLGWILGAMCGDGWIIQSKGDVYGFALADNDGFNIAKMQQLLQLKFGVTVAPSKVIMKAEEEGGGRHGDTVSYRFSSLNLGTWFRELLGGSRDESTSGSANKHLPAFYLSAPRAFREGLLCGLMDTDGSISVSGAKSKPQLMASMGSTSLRLAIETKLLAASLGIFSRITPSHTPKGKDFWQLTFSSPDIQKWNAPFMTHAVKLVALRSVPKITASAVTARFDIVPVSQSLADSLAKAVGCPKISKGERKASGDTLASKKAQQALYMSFAQCRNPNHDKHGAVSRQQAEEVIRRLGEERIADMPDGTIWLRIVRDTAVTWERVTGVQKTGIKEDGYDLTVPGYETFMSADGVILSNTINVNVPVLPDTVEEARTKLLPSNMKFSIRNEDQVMGGPKHEQVLGLYTASSRSSGKVHQFSSRDEAMKAVEQGKVAFDDELEFPD